MKKKGSFWFWLLFLILILFWGLTIDAPPYLSSDDMGKDLYPFEMALRGHWPCRDYYWQYGPLMLFYYSSWLAVGGIHLLSVRLGYAALYILSSILCFKTLRLLVSPPVAFLASLSFLIQGMVYPFYNFNHIGAIPLLLVSIFSLWKFLREGKVRWGYFGTLALIGMALVKWNMAAAAFLAFFTSLFLPGFGVSSKKRHAILFVLIFGGVVLGLYGLQYAGVPLVRAKQCFGLGVVDPRGGGIELWMNFKHLLQWFFVWDRKRLGWAALIVIFGALGFFGLKKKEWNQTERKMNQSAIASLFLFGIFNSSDFFLIGHIYRLDFWTFPILVLLMGLFTEWAKSLVGPKMRILFGGSILLGILALPLQSVREAFAGRVPERYLDFPRGRVYVVKETLSTVDVMKKGTHFILENTKADQEILTLPKDPLYCFLSGRRHATREIELERTNLIPEWEEEEMIRELETKQVPLILLSNRDESNRASAIRGMGYFGKTHLLKLGKYILEHYEEVQTFGTWETPNPRLNHAVKIFRRISPDNT